MTQSYCPVHPTVRLRCPACAGRKGGQSISPKKRRAARQNVRKAREERPMKTLVVLLCLLITSVAAAEPVELAGFMAYAPSFTGGAHVAMCGQDSSGTTWTLVGPGAGHAPLVQLFGITAAGAVVPQTNETTLLAYTPSFLGGVAVSCTLVGDTAYLLTGAGPGGGPHVRLFTVTLPAP